MRISEENVEVIIDALVSRIKRLEADCNWYDLKIAELKEENKKLKGDNNGKA